MSNRTQAEAEYAAELTRHRIRLSTAKAAYEMAQRLHDEHVENRETIIERREYVIGILRTAR